MSLWLTLFPLQALPWSMDWTWLRFIHLYPWWGLGTCHLILKIYIVCVLTNMSSLISHVYIYLWLMFCSMKRLFLGIWQNMLQVDTKTVMKSGWVMNRYIRNFPMNFISYTRLRIFIDISLDCVFGAVDAKGKSKTPATTHWCCKRDLILFRFSSVDYSLMNLFVFGQIPDLSNKQLATVQQLEFIAEAWSQVSKTKNQWQIIFVIVCYGIHIIELMHT